MPNSKDQSIKSLEVVRDRASLPHRKAINFSLFCLGVVASF